MAKLKKSQLNETFIEANGTIPLTANWDVGAYEITAQNVLVDDEAYGVGWNGSLEVPTKNAIYDKIETIGGDITAVGDVTSGAAFDGTQGTSLTWYNVGGNATMVYDGTDIDVSKPITVNDGTYTASLGNPGAGYGIGVVAAGGREASLLSSLGELYITDGTDSVTAFGGGGTGLEINTSTSGSASLDINDGTYTAVIGANVAHSVAARFSNGTDIFDAIGGTNALYAYDGVNDDNFYVFDATYGVYVDNTGSNRTAARFSVTGTDVYIAENGTHPSGPAPLIAEDSNSLAVLGGGIGGSFQNKTDAASNQIAVFRSGNRTVPTDNDEGYLTFTHDNNLGTQQEFTRISSIATDVTSTTKDGNLSIDVMVNNSLTEVGRFTDGGLEVPDEAYGVSWNGSVEVPTKNAVYDKIESLALGQWTDTGTLLHPTDNSGAEDIAAGGTTALDSARASFYKGGVGLSVQNTSDAASNQVGVFRSGNRAVPTDNDEGYLSFYNDDSTGTQVEFSRLSWVADDVTNTSKESSFTFDVMYNNVLTEVVRIQGDDVGTSGGIMYVVDGSDTISMLSGTSHGIESDVSASGLRTAGIFLDSTTSVYIADGANNNGNEPTTIWATDSFSTVSVCNGFVGLEAVQGSLVADLATPGEAAYFTDGFGVVSALDGTQAFDIDTNSGGQTCFRAYDGVTTVYLGDGFGTSPYGSAAAYFNDGTSTIAIGDGLTAITTTGLGVSLDVQNITDAVSNQVAVFKSGNRVTAVDNDEGYLSFNCDNNLGQQQEFVRLSWVAEDVTSTTKDGAFNFDVMVNNSLTQILAIDGTGTTVVGDVSGTTIGGITEANLVDKSATEVITGSWDFGGAGSLEIPNSATPTVNADGEIAVDTTVTDFSLGVMKFYGGEEQGVVSMPVAEFTSPADGEAPVYNATNDEFEMRSVPAITYENSTDVNSGANSPTVWTDLDLSSVVGAKTTVVALRIEAGADMDAVAVRRNGDTNDYFDVAGEDRATGLQLGHHDSTFPLTLQTVTDSSGVIEWNTEVQRAANVYVIWYIN